MDAHHHFAVGHVGLNVTDLARSKQFYQHLFGFELLGESATGEHRWALLGHDKAAVLTLWQQSTGRFDRTQPGLHHLSFRVANLDAVRAGQAKVAILGARFLHEGIVAHAEGRDSGGIYFEDPDGLRLEIFAPAGVGEFAPAQAGHLSCGFF